MTRFLSLTLALLIAVTSQPMAMARGVAMDAAGPVILCTGQGPVSVVLDRQGNPIEGTGGLVHICPDCALTLLAAIDAPNVVPLPVIHMQILAQTFGMTPGNPVIPTTAQARAPPLFV